MRIASEQVFEHVEDALDFYERMERTGEPMFTPADIFETEHILDQMLRGVFVKRGITYQYFSERYRYYSLNVLGVDQQLTNSGKGNLLKALRRGNITPKTLDITFRAVGLQVTDCAFQITDVTGGHMTHPLEEYRLSSFREDYGSKKTKRR